MTEKIVPFGSYSTHSKLDIFCRQTSSGLCSSSGRPMAAFGKRRQPVYQNISLQHVRLSHLLSQLKALFGDSAIPGEVPGFALVGEPEEPRLLIADGAVVTIDSETGYFVFREKTVDADVIVVTTSEDRLIDKVVCYLAVERGAAESETYNIAARMLVGETLADIERRIILQTLRHCHGNRTRMAEMLGISMQTIRHKLRSYWLTTNSGD